MKIGCVWLLLKFEIGSLIYFQINQMIIPGSSYWNFAFWGVPGDVLKDEEGMKTMSTLGENMAWVMKKLG